MFCCKRKFDTPTKCFYSTPKSTPLFVPLAGAFLSHFMLYLYRGQHCRKHTQRSIIQGVHSACAATLSYCKNYNCIYRVSVRERNSPRGQFWVPQGASECEFCGVPRRCYSASCLPKTAPRRVWVRVRRHRWHHGQLSRIDFRPCRCVTSMENNLCSIYVHRRQPSVHNNGAHWPCAPREWVGFSALGSPREPNGHFPNATLPGMDGRTSRWKYLFFFWWRIPLAF
jgi:hypothetical protein